MRHELDLIYFSLASYGMTQILVFGSIFSKIRPSKESLNGFGKLFHCPMCMGFWVGLFLWSINKYTELFTFDYSAFTALCMGCIGSGVSYMLSMLVNDFGLKVKLGGD